MSQVALSGSLSANQWTKNRFLLDSTNGTVLRTSATETTYSFKTARPFKDVVFVDWCGQNNLTGCVVSIVDVPSYVDSGLLPYTFYIGSLGNYEVASLPATLNNSINFDTITITVRNTPANAALSNPLPSIWNLELIFYSKNQEHPSFPGGSMEMINSSINPNSLVNKDILAQSMRPRFAPFSPAIRRA